MADTKLSSFIWDLAELMRGPYKPSEYGKVILPFTVLRRLDCVLEPTKAAVLEEKAHREAQGLDPEPFMLRKAGQLFCNGSAMDLKKLKGDPDKIPENLRSYINAFSAEARDIFSSFKFDIEIDKLDESDLLYLVTEKFSEIDLHPDRVSNYEMGIIFEELIRKFAESANDDAGDFYTPREVIKLIANLVFIEDSQLLSSQGAVRSIYDPTAGTGGMLTTAEEHIKELNPSARLVMFGQDWSRESYAICKSDMLIKGQDANNIHFGNSLDDDQLTDSKFDYMLANPPYGVDWKSSKKFVEKEHKAMGYSGRFGPGLPRVSDGSLLFLLHLISKMRPAQDGGCRFGIVLNGSPLFTGGAGSGESEIRRYVLENDLLEGIIALPTDMFYNTSISTYIWILSNKKPAERKGKVQLIDASDFWQKMRKSLGSKRKELSAEHIDQITKLFGSFEEAEQDGKPISKIFKNEDFGYQTITVERPMRNEEGSVVLGQRGKAKGKPQADSSLRDTENVPLSEEIEDYFAREVLPHVPDAWIDHAKTKTGYEIPFNRHFYIFTPPRPLEEIDAELKHVTDRILEMIGGLSA